MGTKTRTFNCKRCHKQVFIDTQFYRGNVYCSRTCSKISRQKSLRASGKKYQTSRQGQFKHAKKQKQYRDKLKLVTHHTSQD
jgi:hypothetical protein